jgi:glycosyltransferase involved in cell wall biosynthesis
MDDRFSISFIIPVLNGADTIGDCLKHINAEMKTGDEIIVVDNGSTDETLEIVKGFDKVKILQFPSVTIAGLRNRGAEIACGEILAFIDADCLISPGWRQAVQSIMSDGKVHATGSMSAVPPSAPWVERAWLSLRYRTRTKVYYLGSANFIVRKDAFDVVGGFDETLVTDEDTDIGIRLTENGYTIVEDPATRMVHLGNSKTLKQYYNRQKWHATSMMETAFKKGVDKPFIMTMFFMLGLAYALINLLTSRFSGASLLLFFMSIVLIPALNAFYKLMIFKNFKHFFHLTVLYLVFYLARSLTIIQYLLKRFFYGVLKLKPDSGTFF